jgi:hypothetical protein
MDKMDKVSRLDAQDMLPSLGGTACIVDVLYQSDRHKVEEHDAILRNKLARAIGKVSGLTTHFGKIAHLSPEALRLIDLAYQGLKVFFCVCSVCVLLFLSRERIVSTITRMFWARVFVVTLDAFVRMQTTLSRFYFSCCEVCQFVGF